MEVHLESSESKSFSWRRLFNKYSGYGRKLDILSVMRGAQNFIYDLIDDPQNVKNLLKLMDKLYFIFYDQM